MIMITNRHVPSPWHDLSFWSRHFVFAWPSLSHKVGKELSDDDEDDDDDDPNNNHNEHNDYHNYHNDDPDL